MYIYVYIKTKNCCPNAHSKLHDPVAYRYNSTLKYRRDLVKRQITLCKNNINILNLETQKIREKLESFITPEQLPEFD